MPSGRRARAAQRVLFVILIPSTRLFAVHGKPRESTRRTPPATSLPLEASHCRRDAYAVGAPAHDSSGLSANAASEARRPVAGLGNTAAEPPSRGRGVRTARG